MSETNVKKTSSYYPVLNDFFDTDRFFNMPYFDGGLQSFFGVDRSKRLPSVNVHETEKAYFIDVAAPGLKKSDFKIEIADGVLSISSEKEDTQETQTKDYMRKEFSYSSFSRSFTLPDDIVNDNIEAKYEDGVLKIEIPKKEVTVTKPKKTISVG